MELKGDQRQLHLSSQQPLQVALRLSFDQGYVATDFNPELRGQDPISQQILSRIPYGAWAKPFDMAGAAVYLASPASDYVCGQALVVDGGVRP